ncbi:MAG: M16 family metallopeptidase [Bacteroidota bacterium]|jgi:zinc protease
MINFNKFSLENGLKVLVHEDDSTPMACVNILYDVGARDEDPEKTGFAHLFEHLMFGGSVNIPNYDTPLQLVGGENNAFTTNDITNYYLTLPANNLETAFWLESDRMLSLAFSEKSLEVQRGVVIEEFKQRYLNQPYGDVWLLLRPMAYKIHPYRWPTIGKEISHIENATMQDVKDFFKKFYIPSNAILVIAGNVKTDEVKILAEKWFGPIPSGLKFVRNLPAEPRQLAARKETVYRDVPANAIYKVYHMCSRKDQDFYATDIISDILSRGNSARLYIELVKNKKLFSDVSAYVMAEFDKSLFCISGKISEGVSVEDAEKGINDELMKIVRGEISEREITKCKNKIEASLIFSETDLGTKATNLAIYELFGDANGVNTEGEKFQAVKLEDIVRVAEEIFVEENCTTLYYLKK